MMLFTLRQPLTCYADTPLPRMLFDAAAMMRAIRYAYAAD